MAYLSLVLKATLLHLGRTGQGVAESRATGLAVVLGLQQGRSRTCRLRSAAQALAQALAQAYASTSYSYYSRSRRPPASR